VFVHCHRGVSRSAAMVIAWLMYSKSWDYENTFKHVKSRRGLLPSYFSVLSCLIFNMLLCMVNRYYQPQCRFHLSTARLVQTSYADVERSVVVSCSSALHTRPDGRRQSGGQDRCFVVRLSWCVHRVQCRARRVHLGRRRLHARQ
jgi:hypothetical protein